MSSEMIVEKNKNLMKKKLPIKSAYLLPTYDCIFKYLSSACIIQ